MNDDRLSELHLLPPRGQSAWRNLPVESAAQSIERRDGITVPVQVPLFWYEPAWVELPESLASQLACATSDLGVVTSGLYRDFSVQESAPEFFLSTTHQDESEDDQPESYRPRMTPYRAERFGLVPQDFDESLVIDVRFAATRDRAGRYAYSPTQMSRWERVSSAEAIAGGGLVACSSFPADIASPKQARIKLDQLRRLAPKSAVMVSVDAYHLQESLAHALTAKPDGVILRADAVEFDGLSLAKLVRDARRFLDEKSRSFRPLWVVPGKISVRDAVKLFALGANAVAIDRWCEPMVETLRELGQRSYHSVPQHEVSAMAIDHLWPCIDETLGLLSSVAKRDDGVLGSYDSRWADELDAVQLD
ncbi:MAG: hypothetical protein AAFV88_13030 [Planctomycetota bacterium]